MDDTSPPRPPGHTCPRIDRTQQVLRRLAWRVRNKPECPEDEVAALLAEGLALLEQVREENRTMRAAYYTSRRT
jgi:hypothetical protein